MWERCGDLIVDVQDGEHFHSRDSMQCQDEYHSEANVESNARLLACFDGCQSILD